MRIALQGPQMSAGGLPPDTITQMVHRELCATRTATETMIALMREVVAELKEIKLAIQENNQNVKDGITKADESLAEARLMRDELATTKTHIAEAKAAVEADTLSRRTK